MYITYFAYGIYYIIYTHTLQVRRAYMLYGVSCTHSQACICMPDAHTHTCTMMRMAQYGVCTAVAPQPQGYRRRMVHSLPSPV